MLVSYSLEERGHGRKRIEDPSGGQDHFAEVIHGIKIDTVIVIDDEVAKRL